MAHERLGDKNQARECHDKAIEWMQKKKPHDNELQRFQAEAAALLGIDSPSPTRKTSTVQGTEKPNRQGFVSLFNGKDLTGWKKPECANDFLERGKGHRDGKKCGTDWVGFTSAWKRKNNSPIFVCAWKPC